MFRAGGWLKGCCGQGYWLQLKKKKKDIKANEKKKEKKKMLITNRQISGQNWVVHQQVLLRSLQQISIQHCKKARDLLLINRVLFFVFFILWNMYKKRRLNKWNCWLFYRQWVSMPTTYLVSLISEEKLNSQILTFWQDSS